MSDDGDELRYARTAMRLYAHIRRAVTESYLELTGVPWEQLSREDDITIGVVSSETWKRVLPDFPRSRRTSARGTAPPSTAESPATAAVESATTAPTGSTGTAATAGSTSSSSLRSDRRRW
mgnify:FL=1